MRRTAAFFLFFILALAACAGRSGSAPTPFPTAAASLTPAGSGPIVLTLTELAAAPGLYKNALVQVAGLLRKQPVVICDQEYFPSPATWGLAEGGILTLAGGFDQQVRELLPNDMQMTVEGRWRQWQGIVGCGKHAQQREVWYLDVSRIASPSPLARVTLTPAPGLGGGEDATAVTDISPTPPLDVTEEATPDPVEQETLESELPPATLPPGGYPGGDTGPPPGATGPGLPTAQTPGTTAATTPAGTPTPGGTGTPPGSATPTVTGTPPTPSATGTSSAPGQIVERGDLLDLFEEFDAVQLAAGTADSWTLTLFGEMKMFVHTIAPAPADLVISVLHDGQTIIDRQNNAPAGSPEIINGPTLPGEGEYEIRVTTAGGQTTEYAIAVHTFADLPIAFNGFITSGNPHSGVILPVDAVHYWFFTANAGDDLTLTLDPIEELDPAVFLYEPGAQFLTTIDNGVEGQTETETITLSTTGMYVIQVIEYYSEQMTYSLSINLQ